MKEQIDLSFTAGKKAIRTNTRKLDQVLEFFETEERLKEIAGEIVAIRMNKKDLTEQINKLFGEAEALGVPKKALRLAIELLDEHRRDAFDKGLTIARRALNIAPQMEFQLETKGEKDNDRIRN